MQLTIQENPSTDWDRFVESRPEASLYHRAQWAGFAREVFGQRTWFIEARDGTGGALIGVLPLVEQRSLVFGRFMTSLPYFSYGGAVAASDDIARALMEAARELAARERCRYLELRDCAREYPGWTIRRDKATLRRKLPASMELLGKELGSKLRSQVRRADRENPHVRQGHGEILGDFYAVFCEGMRDLGTPVYKKAFFARLLESFPEQSLLVVLYRGSQPAAGGLLTFNGGIAEIPWAACIASAKPAGFNMRLYWELLSVCIARGCSVFDFGRSTVDSGTYKFKRQWGAEPVPLCWHRWQRSTTATAESEAASGEHGKMIKTATALWKRLPLPVANRLGPWLSPGLPW